MESNFIALGTLLALMGGASLDTLSKLSLLGDLAYQKVHFSIFYIGFALILYGLLENLEAAQTIRRRTRTLVWVCTY